MFARDERIFKIFRIISIIVVIIPATIFTIFSSHPGIGNPKKEIKKISVTTNKNLNFINRLCYESINV